MNEEERARLAQMPDIIQVWRGTGHRKGIKGLSWTYDLDKAHWFARRFGVSDHKFFVASGSVRKSQVFALLLGRGESEVVASEVNIERVSSEKRCRLPDAGDDDNQADRANV
jgi:hypothetical protein